MSKPDLSAANAARLDAALGKLYRFDGVVTSWRNELATGAIALGVEHVNSDGTIERGFVYRAELDAERIAHPDVPEAKLVAFCTWRVAPKMVVDHARTLGIPTARVSGLITTSGDELTVNVLAHLLAN